MKCIEQVNGLHCNGKQIGCDEACRAKGCGCIATADRSGAKSVATKRAEQRDAGGYVMLQGTGEHEKHHNKPCGADGLQWNLCCMAYAHRHEKFCKHVEGGLYCNDWQEISVATKDSNAFILKDKLIEAIRSMSWLIIFGWVENMRNRWPGESRREREDRQWRWQKWHG